MLSFHRDPERISSCRLREGAESGKIKNMKQGVGEGWGEEMVEFEGKERRTENRKVPNRIVSIWCVPYFLPFLL